MEHSILCLTTMKMVIYTHQFQLQFTLMRVLIAVIIALAILNAYAQDEADVTIEIPQSQQKALEDAVKFKKSLAATKSIIPENLEKNRGFFNSLFGSDEESQDNKIKFSRGQNDQNSANGKDINQQLNGIKQLMNTLPYEALLPRRRQPLGLLNQILKGTEEQSEQSEDNPLKDLEQLLSGRKRNKGKKIHWQNPDFQEGKLDAPFMKIFGPKSKGKHRVQVKEEDIQKLLVESMPSLKGGNIVKLSYVPHRKGIFLNIEYETAKEQIYTIKAKYRSKTNQLEIINLTQINVLRKVEDDDEEDSNDKVEITVAKQQSLKPIVEKEKSPEPTKVPVEIPKVQQKGQKEQKAEKKVQIDNVEKSEPKKQKAVKQNKKVLKKSISKEPISKEPISKEPISKEPIAKEPIAKESISKESISKQIAKQNSKQQKIPKKPTNSQLRKQSNEIETN